MRRRTLAISFSVTLLISVHLFLFETSGKTAVTSQKLLERADSCRIDLSKSKEEANRQKWIECIGQYKEVAQSHPQSEEAGLALFRAARIYTRLFKLSGKQQDLDDAIELYRRVVYDYPHHRIADDAQFGIGQIYYEQKNDLSQAYVEFLKVDIKYPEGDMRPKAKVMLEKIADTMSRKDERKTGKEVSQSPSSHSVQVQGIRHWSTPSYTRVVIDLERPVPYESKLLKEDKAQNKPGRLYLDLRGAHVPSDINTAIPISDGLLKGARAAQYSRDTVRVVLDIESIEGYKIFPLHDPYRIVVDVRGTNAKQEPEKAVSREAKVEKRAARKGIRRADKPDEQVSMARQLGLTVKKIVVDPGHGGKDPGSLLDSGLYEKEIVLSLAQILAKKMEERLGVEVALTRNRDVFLPLEKRTAFANMQKADLFLSLHINAHKQADVYGLETYFLNMATDERAVMVAARENATSEKNISDLQKILNDLMLNTKISESSKLAHEVQKGMVGSARKKYEDVKDLGVKQAPFYVLIGAEMPAILVETGFLTNPVEKKRLQNRKYLESIADGIVAGIEVYVKSLEKVPARGQRLAHPTSSSSEKRP